MRSHSNFTARLMYLDRLNVVPSNSNLHPFRPTSTSNGATERLDKHAPLLETAPRDGYCFQSPIVRPGGWRTEMHVARTSNVWISVDSVTYDPPRMQQSFHRPKGDSEGAIVDDRTIDTVQDRLITFGDARDLAALTRELHYPHDEGKVHLFRLHTSSPNHSTAKRIAQDSTVEVYTLRGRVELPSLRPRINTGDLTPVVDPITKLTRECSALRLKLATAERRERRSLCGSFTAPSSARTPPSASRGLDLESAFAHRDAARSQIQIEVMKLAERYKVLEQTLREMQDALRAKDREIESLRKERDRLLTERDRERDKLIAERDAERQKCIALQDQRNRERSRSRSHARENRDDHRRDHDTNGYRQQEQPRNGRYRPRKHEEAPPLPTGPAMTLDVEKTARSRGLEVFLTKTDNWSGAQVIQAVQDINAEILQFAASATESCTFTRRARNRPLSVHSAMLEDDSAPWLGPPLTQLLATRDHAHDPILVQLALQASVATCCARSLSLFCVGFPSKLDGLLSRVFAYMQTSEPQATSALWRALTHRSVRMLYPGLEEYAINELINTMLRWSATVFALSGAASMADPSAPPSSSAGSGPSLNALRVQLRRIAEAVYKLARVTREEILSTRFDVILVENGEAFEDGFMTNKLREYGEWLGSDHGSVNGNSDSKSHGGDHGTVWCTTELGLRCITKKDLKTVESNVESEVFESRMLLLPKVVLDSAVDAIDRG